MKTYAREAIIGALLLINICLIYLLLEKGIGFTNILDFKTVFSSVATFGGAALGAMLAGRYTLKSVNEQKNIQDEREIQQLEIQSIKFHESYRRVFNLLSFYCDLFHGYHDETIDDIKEFEEYSKLKFKDVPKLFESRVEEIRKYSLELKMDRKYEILLIEYLEYISLLNIEIQRWRSYEDQRDEKILESWIEKRIKVNEVLNNMYAHIEQLKKKLNIESHQPSGGH